MSSNPYTVDGVQPTLLWRERFVQSSPVQASTLLLHAAEELSFFHAERIEEKTLEERNLQAHIPTKVHSSAEVLALLHQMRDESAAGNLARLYQAVTNAARRNGSIWEVLSQWSEDVSKQFLALSYVLSESERQGATATEIEILRDAVDSALFLRGPEIRAGLNTIAQASEYGKDKATADTFRTTYRDVVLGQQTISHLLGLLIERFGDRLEQGIALLRSAVGSELMATNRSVDATRLHLLLQDLYQLASISSLISICEVVTARLARLCPSFSASAFSLLRALVQWTAEQWLVNYHVTLLIEQVLSEQGDRARQRETHDDELHEDGQIEGDTLEEESFVEIVFLNGVLEILRSLPPKVFPSDEHRLQAIAVVQQALDAILIPDHGTQDDWGSQNNAQ